MNRGVGAGGYVIAEGVVGLAGEGVVGLAGEGVVSLAGEGGVRLARRGRRVVARRYLGGQAWRQLGGGGRREVARRYLGGRAGSGKREAGRGTTDEGGSRGKGRNSHYEAVILCGIGLTHKGRCGKVNFYVFVC